LSHAGKPLPPEAKFKLLGPEADSDSHQGDTVGRTRPDWCQTSRLIRAGPCGQKHPNASESEPYVTRRVRKNRYSSVTRGTAQ
jgi:hypothetical protein